MRLCFMVIGVLAMCSLVGWGNVDLGVGFGGLHVAFGGLIARRHGG